MPASELSLQVLLYVQEGAWIAQCIDYDIAAQGDSLKGVLESFGRIFTAQVVYDQEHGKEPLEGLGPAPKEFWDRYRDACRFEILAR